MESASQAESMYTQGDTPEGQGRIRQVAEAFVATALRPVLWVACGLPAAVRSELKGGPQQ